MAANSSILLESGTNELEIVEFCVNDGKNPGYFGVNVAKVREIIRRPKLTTVVSAPAAVAGMICLRDKVIPVIDLAMIIGQTPEEQGSRVMVLEFNKVTVGILVNTVSRIYRLSWQLVEGPPKIGGNSYTTGLVKMDDRIILLLDFEQIIAEMSESSALTAVDEEYVAAKTDSPRKLLVADDSGFIRASICTTLRKAGYLVEEAVDGEAAWSIIENRLSADLFDIDLVLTDIEMPKMDGLHLTSRIRSNERLANLPVYIFSSLASEDNKRKWRGLGADDILTKPDLPMLVDIIGKRLSGLAA